MKTINDKKKRVKFTGDMTTNAVYKSELKTVVKKYDQMFGTVDEITECGLYNREQYRTS